MAIFRFIFGFFTFWIKIRVKFDRLNKNEDKREKSISLGVRAIIQSVICGALVVLFLWGLKICVGNFNNITAGSSSAGMPILTIIGIVATIAGAAAAFIQGLIGAMLYMRYQFKLNKRSIRWVALVVWILVFVAVVAAAASLLTSL